MSGDQKAQASCQTYSELTCDSKLETIRIHTARKLFIQFRELSNANHLQCIQVLVVTHYHSLLRSKDYNFDYVRFVLPQRAKEYK